MNQPSYWDARFKDLPLLKSKPAPMDDDAIRFHSDIQYMHLLLDDMCAAGQPGDQPDKRLAPEFIDYLATMWAAVDAITKAIAVTGAMNLLFLVKWRESSRG